MGERGNGSRPQATETKTEILRPVVEIAAGSGVEVDQKYKEEAGEEEVEFEAMLAAGRKEAATRPAKIVSARERAQQAAASLEKDSSAARRRALFDYLAKNERLNGIVKRQAGTTSENRQKFIERMRIAAARWA